MPTINQIIRKGRTDKKRKTKAPALNVGYDSRKKKQTQRFVNMLVLDYLMVWK